MSTPSGTVSREPLVGVSGLRRRLLALLAVLWIPGIVLLSLELSSDTNVQAELRHLQETGSHVQAQVFPVRHGCAQGACTYVTTLVIPAPGGPYRTRIGAQPYVADGPQSYPAGKPAPIPTTTFWYDPAHPDRGAVMASDRHLIPVGAPLPVQRVLGIDSLFWGILGTALVLAGFGPVRLLWRLMLVPTSRPTGATVTESRPSWPPGVGWLVRRAVLIGDGGDRMSAWLLLGAGRLTDGEQVQLARRGRFAVVADIQGRVLGVADGIKPTTTEA